MLPVSNDYNDDSCSCVMSYRNGDRRFRLWRTEGVLMSFELLNLHIKTGKNITLCLI